MSRFISTPALLCGILAVSSLTGQVHRRLPPPIERIDLVNWTIQSSAMVPETGDVISLPAYNAQTWYAARVPTTVLNSQVSGGILPDPTFDINFQKLPGAVYDSVSNFLVDPQPPDNPYLVSWWYRTQVIVRRLPAADRVWLNFDSINYRANIWLNGKLIADSTQVAGMYRGFEFDVTDSVVPGVNALAVEVIPPQTHDLSLYFVDWNPMPPDNDMGIVRSVYLLTTW